MNKIQIIKEFKIILFVITNLSSFFIRLMAWEEEANRLPTKCEVCKFLTQEVTRNLAHLNSNDLIVNEYFNLESIKIKNNKFKKYKNS